jgi:hypothetical protein
MDEVIVNTMILLNNIYHNTIDVTTEIFHFFYAYSEFCVDHNMI